MAKVVVIEWDENQAKIVVAERRGDLSDVEHVRHVSLDPQKSVGEQIGDELNSIGASRAEVIISIPRSRAEIRTLKVPPAPDDELPEMVRFQAVRQFPSVGEDWIVDFVKLPLKDDSGQLILATAASPQLLQDIRQTCEEANLTPKAAILRPYGKARLIQTECPTKGCVLVVEPCTNEIDLTILVDGEVAYLRSIPRNEVPAASLNDIRRTISAVPMQLSGQQVEHVLVLANDSDPLIKVLDDALDMDVRSHNPLGENSKATRPESDPTGSYSALIGLTMLDPSNAKIIDLLNPTQPPVDNSVRRKGILVATFAVVAVLAAIVFVYLSLARMDSKIAELNEKVQTLESMKGKWKTVDQKLAQLDDFENGNVIWLNELHELSLELPRPEETYVQQMTMLTRPGVGGMISFKAVADEHATIEKLEHAVRDDRHTIRGKGGTETPNASKYPWSYEEVVLVGIKEDPDDITSKENDPVKVANDDESKPAKTKTGESKTGKSKTGKSKTGKSKTGKSKTGNGEPS